MASKRRTVSPRGDKRFVRRDRQGQFSEVDDAGRSLGADRRQRAKRTVGKGEGDRGDQRSPGTAAGGRTRSRRGSSSSRSRRTSGGSPSARTSGGASRRAAGTRSRRTSGRRLPGTSGSGRSRSSRSGRRSESRTQTSSPRSGSAGRQASSAGEARVTRSRGGQGTDATALLKADHRKVAALFEQFEAAKEPSRKKEIFREIKMALDVHTKLEEELFYREADQQGDEKLHGMLEEARGEHDEVKDLIHEAEGRDPESGEFDAGVAAIKGAVEHHVADEEGEMFPQVRTTFTPDELRDLGARMQERQAELRKEEADKEKPGILDKLAEMVGIKEQG